MKSAETSPKPGVLSLPDPVIDDGVVATIVWVGPEVAKLWPYGSKVLANRLDVKASDAGYLEVHQYWNGEIAMRHLYNENTVFALLDENNLLQME